MAFNARCWTPPAAALMIAMLSLSASSTGSYDRSGRVCPPVVEYSTTVQARGVAESEALPEGAVVVRMVSNYAVMREPAGENRAGAMPREISSKGFDCTDQRSTCFKLLQFQWTANNSPASEHGTGSQRNRTATNEAITFRGPHTASKYDGKAEIHSTPEKSKHMNKTGHFLPSSTELEPENELVIDLTESGRLHRVSLELTELDTESKNCR
ncbi:hypothetical protein [Oceaniovalibus sp. ACAM 378]|uniref:hypothetical protein n=1 Tax=Oceaniovalibus sp. ACAM 378 TaxID=2599923 RepID=UPI0016523F1C|nr:hypothetical protein [Oceaniovalibus sp. ACAM 378]